MSFRSHPMLGHPNAADETCTIWYIRRKLGINHYGDRRTITYVTKLIEQKGFPPPLPDMSIRQNALIDDVTINSRWIRAAVDAWLDNFLPPDAAMAIDAAAQRAAAAEMDEAAKALRLVGGREA